MRDETVGCCGWKAAVGLPATCLVSDGARGLAKAASAVWPATRIQRCTFHAASQAKGHTTLNPKLECGRELLGIANRLKDARDADAAAAWLADYSDWCTRWERFLREFTLKDGKRLYTHERLRRARRSLSKLVRSGQLFTLVEMGRERGGAWDSTNNAIESRNARIREMLRLHWGLPLIHRIKAGATCARKRRFLQPRSCASCRRMTKWMGCSHQLPASADEMMGRPRNTAQGSTGTSSICPRNTDNE